MEWKNQLVLHQKSSEDGKIKCNIKLLNKSSSFPTTSEKPTQSRKRSADFDLNLDSLARKQDINFGNNTFEYDCYTQLTPKYQREISDPLTPPIFENSSQKTWDSMIWKKELHGFDLPSNYDIKKSQEFSTIKEEPDDDLLDSLVNNIIEEDLLEDSFKSTNSSMELKTEPMYESNSSGYFSCDNNSFSRSKNNPKFEVDLKLISRKQKDIDYGKNTIGYTRYREIVPKEQRQKKHPVTPPMFRKLSRRSWNSLVKSWRKDLHFWDPPYNSEKAEMSVTSANQPDSKMSEHELKDEDALLDEIINNSSGVDDEAESEQAASPEKKAKRENVDVKMSQVGEAEVLDNGDVDEGEIVEEEEEEEHKCPRSRSRASNSSGDSSSRGVRKVGELETDPGVLARRQKDIDYGKNTMGYDRYIQQIPKEKRTKDHPKTPPMHKKCSRRGWDGSIKLWRKQLHIYDPPNSNDSTATEKTAAKTEKTEDC